MAPLITTGTYTGSRPNGVGTLASEDVKRIALDFVPDLVVVIPEGAYAPVWRSSLSWHGKSQFFGSLSSDYQIGPFAGRIQHPFNGKGFSVKGDANIDGDTYHYVAIADNGSGIFRNTTWIGNEQASRTIGFTDSTPDAVFVKRDASRQGVWRIAGSPGTVLSDFQGGTGGTGLALASSGLTVNSSNLLNENVPPALGEGIEGLALFADGSKVSTGAWLGNAAADRVIDLGISASVVFVFDYVNDGTGTTQPHAIVTDTMSAGEYKVFAASALSTDGEIASLSGSSLTLDAAASYNASGRAYYYLALGASSGTEAADSVPSSLGTKASRFTRSTGYATLANSTVGSEASTVEWYGRVELPEGTGRADFIPLIMSGQGASKQPTSAPGDYNFGLYLATVDPDGNDPDGSDWDGYALRWLQSDYLSIDRTGTENDINRYNLNSGVVLIPGKDYHVCLTHDGSGHWRLYVNGEIVKDYLYDASTIPSYTSDFARTIGGAGTSKPTYLSAYHNGTSVTDAGGATVYLASWWEGTELSRAEVKARYDKAVRATGSGVSTSPTEEYDFRIDGEPAGAALTNATTIDRETRQAMNEDITFRRLRASGVNVTSFTSSDLLTEAGSYILGVLGLWANDAGTFDTVTADGVDATLIATDTVDLGTRAFRVSWYAVTTDSAGDVFIDNSGTAIYVAACLWDAGGVDTSGTSAIAGASTSGTVEADATGLGQSDRVYAMGSFTSGNQAGRTFFEDGAYIERFLNIGSTSRVAVGSGGAFGTGLDRVRMTSASASQIVIALLGLADPALNNLPFAGGGWRSRDLRTGWRSRA